MNIVGSILHGKPYLTSSRYDIESHDDEKFTSRSKPISSGNNDERWKKLQLYISSVKPETSRIDGIEDSFYPIVMGLLSLPDEILLLIAECLSYSWDVSVFSQINRRLYGLLNAYVYQHNIRYLDGYVLSWAAQYGSETTARKMLDAGAKPILSCERPEFSPMAPSVKHGNEPVLRLFLERGVMDLGLAAQWSGLWDNPLRCAVEDGIKYLLQAISPRYINRDDLEELAKCEGKAVRRRKWTNVMMLQRFKARLENDPWIYEDCDDEVLY